MRRTCKLIISVLMIVFCQVSFGTGCSAEGVISAGNDITVAMREDGTVYYGGVTDPQISGAGACAYWTDIVSVSAGQGFVVGLKDDGKTVITKYKAIDASFIANGYEDYEPWQGEGLDAVNTWENIVAVSAGSNHVVGLRNDGTVVAAGSNAFGCCDVEQWEDIISVSAGGAHTVGLKADGTVVAVGDNSYGQCNVKRWKKIVAVSAGGFQTIGLRENGTVAYAGVKQMNQCMGWRNIVEISAGGFHAVGRRSDGTVLSTIPLEKNNYRQGTVESWKNIVAISAGTTHTIGLKSDGTVVAAGSSGNGCCNVSSWTKVKIPDTGY